jgi:threonine dehydrogenase-like Zn-dependent dehydrogenase
MRIAIVGTGLIGASVGLAAKRGGARVVGFDAEPSTAEAAAERGAVDEVAESQALGAERINIEDFELQHVSPERGGTLRVLVAGEDEAARAGALLEAQGYGVVISPVVDE